MDIEKWLLQQKNYIDSYLDEYLEIKNNRQKKIYECMRYSIFAGGKRIRPVLVTSSYSLFRDDIGTIVPFACAIEMIHAYSLIHDDLPALDNDDYRRGKPTNHNVYGEALAILAGDGLLNKAFEIIHSNYSKINLHPEIILQCLNILSDASGSEGMIGGQVTDMFVEEKSLDYIKYMHSHKTGALIQASCQIGAVAGGANSSQLNALTNYAQKLGLAFQIKDDILDVTGDIDKLGKPIGSDFKNQKLTYVSLLGLDKSKKLLEQYTDEAISSLSEFGEQANTLKNLAIFLLEREK